MVVSGNGFYFISSSSSSSYLQRLVGTLSSRGDGGRVYPLSGGTRDRIRFRRERLSLLRGILQVLIQWWDLFLRHFVMLIGLAQVFIKYRGSYSDDSNIGRVLHLGESFEHVVWNWPEFVLNSGGLANIL